VYVGDDTSDRIQKFDANGKFLAKWGKFGSGEGGLDKPSDVEVDSLGNVYVSNETGWIVKFDSTGKFIAQWTQCGTGDESYMTPWQLGIDAQGNTYVADASHQRVCKFDTNGKFLGTWGQYGTFGEHGPADATVDAQGNVYVADVGKNWIQKFRPVGASSAAPLEKVKIAVGAAVPLIVHLPIDVAKALDLYKQEGLDVTLEYSGGVPAGDALAAGKVDFSAIGLITPITVQSQGKDLRMVVSFSRLSGETLLVRSDLKDKIKSVADLKAQTIGVTAVTPLRKYILAKAGLKPEDVNFDTSGNVVDIASALQNGKSAAGWEVDPYSAQLLKQGKAYALVDLATEADSLKWLGGEYQGNGLVTSAEVITTRPQTVQKLTNALVKALRYITSHSAAEIAAILPDNVTGTDKALYIDGLQHSLPIFPKDGRISPSAVENTIAINKAPNQQVNASALYTNDFVNAVK
jgi:NitT/TauT family transport system substrate-binding protein